MHAYLKDHYPNSPLEYLVFMEGDSCVILSRLWVKGLYSILVL